METTIKRGWYPGSGARQNLKKALHAKKNEEEVRAVFGRIADNLRMSFGEDFLSIHDPVYINIDYDNRFKVADGEFCFNIRNDKVSVSVFKSGYIHITVF